MKSRGPLEGVKVIELCHVMAGPVCGLMLADMGAEVIKVEKMPNGDDTRRTVPPLIGDEAATFMMMNRNKRGIAVDLKTEQGKEILRRLLKTADVLTENFSRGVMERMGFGYETLKATHPRLIYCAISGFGRSGPYADRGGFDLIAQGMSGLMSITGEGPGRPPVKVGAPVTDITAGILGAMGILAALHARSETGKGQMVDTSLFEAGIVHTFWQSAIGLATGVAPGPMGSAHPLNAPYEAFATKDGWINLGAANQATWLRAVKLLDRTELAEDPRFKDASGRLVNRVALAETLAPEFMKRTSAEWLEAFDRAKVPAGPVLNVIEMHADPQTRARNMVVEVNHATLGPVRTLGTPIKFSETPGGVHRSAPIFGQHTAEVLREYGFTDEEIDNMASSGAIHRA
ncbi:MAG: CoA transferase [Xanthobacteraceae bacterium]|nr:CoA transferase [Xanthobacteraceae bacterium]MCW5677060.1 CoA transferase [Xanthobacteraceae bacterium]